MPALARHGVLAGLLALLPAVWDLLVMEGEPTPRSVVLALVGILLIVASGSAGVLLGGDE